MKKLLLSGVMMLMVGTLTAKAGQTGLASIHELGTEKGVYCMTGHYHEGTGNGATRKAAEASAANSWAMFVELEYGTDWAHHSVAHGKTMTCKPQTGFWSCSTSARPCLRQVGAVRSAAARNGHSHRRIKVAKVRTRHQRVQQDATASTPNVAK